MGHPNILFLTSHDTGDWLRCYGHPGVHSPNLDALATQGCRFTNSFCSSPICTPSRGAMMTGRYPQSNGLMGLIQTPYRWRYNPGERHLSHLLAERGYHTALFNHQHEAPHDDPLGFAERHVGLGSHLLALLGEKVSTAAETAEMMAAFFRERAQSGRPFYAQAGFYDTHTPYSWNGAPPDASSGVGIPPGVVDSETMRQHVAGLQGAVRVLDEGIGGILKALAEAGLDGNTIVVYTVDHGVQLPRCKWEVYDGGLRTALLMRWPEGGIAGGRTVDGLVGNVDIVPTLLELAGLPVPANMEGVSFAPAGRGLGPVRRDAVFAMMHSHYRWVESRCVRTARHKLIRNFSPSRQPKLPAGAGDSNVERPVLELYDLAADPAELNNLAGKAASAEVQRDLDARLLKWLRDVKDPILRGPIRTPYYDRAAADLGI
jgi:arylsulfatase A-like enzyme